MFPFPFNPMVMIGGILFIMGLVLVCLVLWVWALVDAITNDRLNTGERLLWVLLIVFTSIIGALLYLLMGRDGRKTSKKKESKSRTLIRPKDRMIAGVCAAFARYFRIDVSLVRVAWVVFTLFGGSGILLYIICWVIIPNERK